MRDLAVIFPYYEDKPVVRFHYERLKVTNPTVDILPISTSSANYLPGTLRPLPELVPPENDWWYYSDTLAYSVHKQVRDRGYERYAFIEWDCRVECCLREYFREGWDADLVGNNIYTIQQTPDMSDFQCLHKARPELQVCGSSVSPQNGNMASRRLYDAILDLPELPDLFCEVRLGTLAKFLGLKTVELTNPPCYNYDGRWMILQTLEVPFKGIFHKVTEVPSESTSRGDPGRHRQLEVDGKV